MQDTRGRDDRAPVGWDELLATTKKPAEDDDDSSSSKKDKKAAASSSSTSIGKSASNRIVKKLTDSTSRDRADTGGARDRPASPAEHKRRESKNDNPLPKTVSSSGSRASSEATSSPAKMRTDNAPAAKEIVERDAIWTVDPVTDVPLLRACTLDRAIDKLILESLAPDQQQFLSAFVLTYRFFTVPDKFFELITKRFDLPADPSLDAEGFKRKQQTARLRVCIVLRYWLANCFLDFDDKLLKTVIDFIEYRITPILTSSAQTLLQIIERRRKYSHEPPPGHPNPMPRPLISPEQWNVKLITSMPPLEVARQLTLIEHEIYVQIKSQELVKQAWLKPNKEQVAPNIVASIKRFNLVSNWITTEVLTVPGLRERVTTIEYFIRIAQEFMTLQNYCGLLQVLSALQQTPVQRLKDTWKEVNPKSTKALQELGDIFQPLNNWRLARDLLHRNQPPSIPYIGIYLTDLVFFDEGIPDTEREMINFDKFRKIAQTIQEIQMFQNVSFWIESLPFCRASLEDLYTLPDREMYERSYAIAPRQGKAGAAPTDTKAPARQAAAEAQQVASDVSAKLAQMHASMSAAVNSVLEQRFGRVAAIPWSSSDKTRYVYSWTDEIKVDLVEHDGMTYVVHARLQATKAEISALQRLVQFYKNQTGITDVRGLLIALVASPEEVKMAQSIATIDLVMADVNTGAVLSAPASDDSSQTHSGGESPMNPSPNPLPTSPVSAALSADWGLAPSSTPPAAAGATPGGSAYRNWREFLEAAEVPDEAVVKYVQTLESNAIEIDQIGELNTEILRGLGFKMGHILKILRVVGSITGVTPK